MANHVARAKREQTADYKHGQKAVQRPDVGVQDQFRTKKPPKTYRYDSSLDPAMSWDESRDRELAEWLLGLVQRCAAEGEGAVFKKPQQWAGGGVRVESLKVVAGLLQKLSKPFLNWAGKAERHEISVPTVPLFVHERHSTKAILEGILSRRAKGTNLNLFGDAELDIGERLDAYEHKGPWQNRMILGDSLQVMNSLLEFEGLGGQVQMIYMDPPYGVRFGSNFQPFVRKRDVKHADDAAMTREPEMVKAYRDTWELGLHSYLTYLRDRLRLAHELLHESGSIFVQISDDNMHHVRSVLDEVFGAENFVVVIAYRRLGAMVGEILQSNAHYLIWYGRDKARMKSHKLYQHQVPGVGAGDHYVQLFDEKADESRPMTNAEKANPESIPPTMKASQLISLATGGFRPNTTITYAYKGQEFHPGPNKCWRTTKEGLDRLAAKHRLAIAGKTLRYRQYLEDFPFAEVASIWNDTARDQENFYVVQTPSNVIARCVLMTTEPGDLVFDPTCGSGTTAYVAEQWGRRWITCDTSRVPLALARQRLLTATFPYYELKDHQAGPAGGFLFKRRQNRRGEEIGGVVPHVTLKSLANEEPPVMEILVDRPEVNDTVTRVSGPFVVEATITPAQELDGERGSSAGANIAREGRVQDYVDPATHIDRMVEVLRQSKTLNLPGNRSLVLTNIRRATDSDLVHAEATEGDSNSRVAIVFGPEDGAISSDVVYNAASEAVFLRHYTHLYFFGFAIQAKARELIDDRKKLRIPCTYVAVTPDVVLSDLLKTNRASEIFSITGLPDIKVRKTKRKNDEGVPLYEVELLGLDTFNPATMEDESTEAELLPAWMLDTDYDGLSFIAMQMFFPKTAAWDNLQKSLKVTFDLSVWDHLAGTVSEPFALGKRKRVAVKVIDERGNELMRVQDVTE